MRQVNNLDEILEIINTGNPVLIYFSGKNCSVCEVLKPKIETEVKLAYPNIKLLEVKTEANPTITSHFTVFSIPTMLLFLDTKEFKRVGRNISVQGFIQDIKRPYEFFNKE